MQWHMHTFATLACGYPALKTSADDRVHIPEIIRIQIRCDLIVWKCFYRAYFVKLRNEDVFKKQEQLHTSIQYCLVKQIVLCKMLRTCLITQAQLIMEDNG